MTNLMQNEEIINGLSHQLKSPISTVTTLLKTISQGYAGEISQSAMQLVAKALSHSEEAHTLITELLDLSYYTSDPKRGMKDEDINRILSQRVSKHRYSAAERNIAIHFETSENKKIIVKCNVHSVEVVIDNFLENAIKYSRPNSKIIVKCIIYKELGKIEVQFIDSGFGIADNELDKIFEPFYRSTRHKLNTPGSGLGLTIAKRIIDNHEWEIKVSSQAEKGSIFKLRIPYKKIIYSERVRLKRKKIVIIGGVTAGPKAAARLRRLNENLEIVIIEKNKFLSYSGCGIPSYISGRVQSADSLMATADNTIRDIHFFESIKDIKVLNRTIAKRIDRKNKIVFADDLDTGQELSFEYDKLILATGAISIRPKVFAGIASERIFSLYNLEDAEVIRSMLLRKVASDVLIIGGGLIGVETAESLISCGARVTILEEKHKILLSLFDADIAVKMQNILQQKGIKIFTNVVTTNVTLTKNKKRIKLYTNKGTFSGDFAILSAGVRPNSSLGQSAGLELGKSGGIIVNKYLQTADKSIYAIGDCVESVDFITKKPKYLPLGSISTKMGRIIANNICGIKTAFSGYAGTAMFKIFDTNVARTGLSLTEAGNEGFSTESIVISGLDKTHYSPNAKYIVLKLIVDKKEKTILGAQGFGEGNIISKIELIACAILNKMKLPELFNVDLGYSPHFNSPINLIQVASEMLVNKMSNLFRTITVEKLSNLKKFHLIDISPHSEYIISSIPNSINIPLENLRIENIPFSKQDKIILYSRTSSGAYEAYRYLVTRGFKEIFVLEGGYYYWSI